MMKAVLFDIYGTLLDSSEYLSAYSAILKDTRLTPEQREWAWRAFMTQPFPSARGAALWVENEFECGPIPSGLVRQVEQDLAMHTASMFVVPGAIALLQHLRDAGYLLALVSNLSTPYKEPVRRLGLESLVDALIYSCDVGFMKPDVEIFRHALELLQVTALETVMVGDNEVDDCEGARAAGLRALLLGEESARGVRHIGDALPALLRLGQ